MRKLLTFAVALLATAIFLTGCKKQGKVIKNADDATHARIGVMTGTTGEVIARSRFPQAQVKSFDDIMDAVAAMKSGQLDVIVTGYPTAVQVSKRNPDLGMLAESLGREDTSVAIKKGNEQLLASVNQIIAELKRDGTLASMMKRWLKPDLSPYEEPAIVLPNKGTPLKIGVSATREPFSFIDKDGRVTGHDGELARILAAKLGRPIEFSNMKFMALIPALQSGKVDMIVTGMTATKERAKYVDFSQPYFENSQVMLARKTGAAGDTRPAVPAEDSTRGEYFSSLAQISGGRIAVLTGSAGDLAARKHFPKATFQDMTAAADAALAVQTRKVDAFVYDKSVLLNLVEKNSGLVILDEPVARLEVAAAIRKDNVALLSDINRALAELKTQGILNRLKAKWIDSKYSVPPGITLMKAPSLRGVLRVGTCATIEPFSFQASGMLTGLDIELAQLIGGRLTKSIQVEDMRFESLIPALQSGKIDFALSNFNVTEERKKLISFSTPYIENDISALVRRLPQSGVSGDEGTAAKAGGGKLASPADLKDKKVAVLMGSAHDTYATKNYPNANILQYKSPADVALAVKSGKADAALFDEEPLREILREDDSMALLGESLFSFSVGVGFNKNADELRLSFNRFLSQIKQNGVYADMVNRWMEKRELRMPPIDHSKSSGVLVVGVSDAGVPFTLVKDNQLLGFDIELAERFASFLGREVKYSNMEFGSLIAAVSTGKVDMIASSIYVTEERKKQINFSDPYYEMGTRVFALKSNMAAYGAKIDAKTAPVPFLTAIANSFHNNIILEKRYLLIWDGLKTTVILSIFATIFGTLLGALVCSMRMSKRRLMNVPAKVYINILRGTPVLVLLMLIFYVVFASVSINPVLVAVIAFGMNFAAYVSEMFRTGIEGVDHGQTEAGIAMGFSKAKTFLYIVLPQALRRILPVYKGEFISLVKMTSIVGYIAVQDLTKASDIIRSRTFDAFFPLIMVAVLYFAISWGLMQSLEYLERVTDPKYRRRKASLA